MLGTFYYENIIRSLLLSKYNYLNAHEIPSFKECILTISFSNENIEEDINILYALTLLELITAKKAYIKNVSSVYKSKVKTLIFTFQVSLKKSNIFDFLTFFYFGALPLFKLRYIKRNLNIDKRSFNYNFAFKDTNIFPFLPEVFYKWNFLLNFSFTVVFCERTSIKEIEDFYNFFYLVGNFNTENNNDFENPFIVSDTEVLSLSLYNTKITRAIIEIEKRANELKEEEEKEN